MASLKFQRKLGSEAARFANCRSQPVAPRHFAILAWDGSADTLYAFEHECDFQRQCAAACRHGVEVKTASLESATEWIATGGRAVLFELSVAGAAAFTNLKLQSGEDVDDGHP